MAKDPNLYRILYNKGPMSLDDLKKEVGLELDIDHDVEILCSAGLASWVEKNGQSLLEADPWIGDMAKEVAKEVAQSVADTVADTLQPVRDMFDGIGRLHDRLVKDGKIDDTE